MAVSIAVVKSPPAAGKPVAENVRRGRSTRRQFLKVAGIGGTAVGVGGLSLVSWRGSSQGVFASGQGSAYAAWGEWNQGHGPIALVRAAILAANPHNTQPWRFRIVGSAIDVFVDASRTIGAIDPFRREQYIGLGCALENLLIAGQARGYQPELTLLPDTNDPTLIAHVQLGTGPATNTELYRTIPRRHTHRAPFDTTKQLSADALAGLSGAVTGIPRAEVVWITGDAPKQRIGLLIVEAARAIAADRNQSADSFRWWRDSWTEIQRFKDGMTIDAAGLSPLVTALGKILPPETREQNDETWIQQTRDNYVRTAAAFGIIVVHDSSENTERIHGGRLYEHLHLEAVLRGLAMQPLNQLTERIDREKLLGLAPRFTGAMADLIPEGSQALMSFRIGYPTVTPARSPRRTADSVLL